MADTMEDVDDATSHVNAAHAHLSDSPDEADVDAARVHIDIAKERMRRGLENKPRFIQVPYRKLLSFMERQVTDAT